jgi:hypothetical protein
MTMLPSPASLSAGDEVGSLKISAVDFARVDELHEVDRLLAFELYGIDLVTLEDDLLVGLDPVPFDDIDVVDLADSGTFFS